MRWRKTRQSSNIDDRRGQGPAQSGLPVAALLRFLPFLLKTKVGKLILVVGGIYLAYQYFTGGAGMMGIQQGTEPLQQQDAQNSGLPAKDEDAQFVAAILGTTETVWKQLLDGQYPEPQLVLYNNITQTGCGMGQAQSGPFYCPADRKIYLDLSFMDELKKLGAPGDFAFAYVIAHEVGHHVQNVLGTNKQVAQQQQEASETEANRLSVMLELQADCYAGVWGYYVHHDMQLLEPGDIEEGLQAASSVGDDRLLEMAGRAVQPDAFTHGTSAQRVSWFKKGFASGNPKDCQTFQSMQ
ncbi:neutral zinc metallopeptidase [Photobacterium galatheae]|uniref:Metalloprotease n=1 Tax=Photobacterium galatheae TaxID=1654360 RepID=A0A066RSE5_9GAMM|nr:neutral zinc metallopeptidase [Photobacterium galatheae]KDM90313.1 metalloprotease [Photobacterium galatheae]MCM0150806.1 neutral zinc metallopeptidase [Photobacterium galatheae]